MARGVALPARGAHLQGWVAAAITAACVIVLLANADLEKIRQAAFGADVRLLLVAMGVSALTIVAKGIRWFGLYPASCRPALSLAVAGLAVGQVVNWAVPFRVGEAFRVGLVGSAHPAAGRTGRRLATGLGVLLVEKVLDCGLLLCALAVLIALVGVPGWLSAGGVLVAIAGCGVGLILGLGYRSTLGVRLAHGLAWMTRRVPVGVFDDAVGLRAGLSAWLSVGAVSQAVTWSLVAWGSGALTNYLVLRSLGVEPREMLAASLAVLVALYGAAIAPALPGRIGVFQSACVVALLPFGVSFEQAVVVSVALYVVVYLPPIALGLGSIVLVDADSRRMLVGERWR